MDKFSALLKRVLPSDDGAKGFLFVVIAGVLWALVSPAARMLGQMGADMVTVVILRQSVAALVLGIWLFVYRRDSFRLDRRTFVTMALFALTGPLAANLGYMMSLRTLTVPVGMAIHYTFPLLTSIGALLVIKEIPRKGEWFGGAMIVVGLTVAAGRSGGIPLVGALWGGASAVAMAIQSLFGRKVSSSRSMTPVVLLFYSNFLGVLWMMGGRWIFMGAPFVSLPMVGVLLASFLALAASCLAYGLFFEGMKYVTASTASLGVTVEILAATSMAAIFLGEYPSVREIIGCAMVMGAVLIAAFSKRAKSKTIIL